MSKHTPQHGSSAPALSRPLILALLAAAAVLLMLLLRGCGKEESAKPSESPAPVSTAPVSTAAPSPVKAAEPESEPTPTPDPYAGFAVAVSEAAADNPAQVPDEQSRFPDWIELYNPGSDADVGGWYLSDKDSDLTRWRIADGTVLPAGGYMLFFADGTDNADTRHTNFSLSHNETVYLSSPDGVCRSSLALGGLEKGQSAQLTEKGIVRSRFVTPGYPNSDEGYAAWQASQTRLSPILIYEAVTSNANSYFHYAVGYTDWVEIRNFSNEVIELHDYTLTDDPDEPELWRLPARKLMPGEIAAFLCSGNESLTEKYYTHTNFALDGSAEGLYLYKDGVLCDFVFLHDIPNEGSMGRQEGGTGFFFIPVSSPHAVNNPGFRLYTATPTALTPDGVFNGVESVTVELQGDGPIYYTTDGSVPTAQSTPYTGPVTLTKTTVIRAACVEEGKLTATPLTLNYIINENHELPVASLVADPVKLMSGGGVYNSPWDYYGEHKQCPASVSLYEQDGSFTADCGVRMFGHTGLNLPKKSFKLLFRSRYGEETLHYDLFDSDVQEFSSLVLRSGQDYPFAIIRDELFTELCADFTDKVLVQADKYCVLYINGQYWGIYCFKEAFSEDYYASHAGVSSESVELQQAPVPLGSDFYYNVLCYCRDHDMTQPENYEHFCRQVDIDSLIDWAIIEGYSANADVQQNLRYFRSAENGNRWQFAFYDLDWAFYYDVNNMTKIFAGIGEDGSELQHTSYIKYLMRNTEFRDKFCRRMAEAFAGPLSDEAVLAKIDELAARVASEVPRERERWHTGSWDYRLEELRTFVRSDWQLKCVNGVTALFGLSEEQRAEYFGSLGF